MADDRVIARLFGQQLRRPESRPNEGADQSAIRRGKCVPAAASADQQFNHIFSVVCDPLAAPRRKIVEIDDSQKSRRDRRRQPHDGDARRGAARGERRARGRCPQGDGDPYRFRHPGRGGSGYDATGPPDDRVASP